MLFRLTIDEVILRLFLAVAVSGLIGYDREHKNRPAGLRTHILVCVGACIIAMVQKEIGFNALNIARAYPKMAGVVRADDARLIAQVVSGIGFLGAGTIIVQHRAVRGLTTAASLWAMACLGLAVGMGNYVVAIAGTLVVFGVLAFLQKIIRVHAYKRIEIQYKHKLETKEFIQNYFDAHHITVTDVNFNVTQTEDVAIYTNIYEIEIPKELNYAGIIEEISMNKNIMHIQTVSV
ncbi:MgtC/SapB family protein [Schleiferilactobacillus harbinensis]|uniref:MgtC/SapB family protein n=1 Tax=Schleiferilactobacillus harbinensis TaxID=304207 RepID=UPI00123A129C|nr:MgtC/SapB family protein [Schleiferilactobacillus harbinensis]QEU47650.1 MgtC/SapB family protein [Schleiferilactobacillus harbinensis]